MKRSLVALFALVGLGSSLLAAPKRPVPNDLELLKALKKTWAGVACTGQLAVSLGEKTQPVLTAPIAVAFQGDTLRWAAFLTPPAPCSGSVVLGGVKVGLGQKPDLLMGTPPGLVVGKGPALLTWKKIERKTEGLSQQNLSNLCGDAGGGDTASIFSGFAGGMGQRPDARSWDTQQPSLLKLEGTTKGQEKSQQGRYTVWLDSARGFLPVKSQRVPVQGPQVLTTYEPKEVTPGHWLPVKWSTSGAGRPTLIGEFQSLRCDRPLPPSWFDQKSYPDVPSQGTVIKAIYGR